MERSPLTTPPDDAVVPERHPEAPPPGTSLGPHYPRCFGCGPDHPTGLHLRATVGAGVSVTAAFTVTADHQGAPGLAHGGVLASAMDEAIGMTIWLLHRPYVTGRLETDYLRPVPVGTTLHILAEVVGVRGRKAYLRAQARLDRPDGELAVRAAALFVAVDIEHFIRHADAQGVRDVVSRHYEVNP